MKEVGKEGDEKIGNHRVEPEKFVAWDETGNDCIDNEVSDGEDDADEGEDTSAGGGFHSLPFV